MKLRKRSGRFALVKSMAAVLAFGVGSLGVEAIGADPKAEQREIVHLLLRAPDQKMRECFGYKTPKKLADFIQSNNEVENSGCEKGEGKRRKCMMTLHRTGHYEDGGDTFWQVRFDVEGNNPKSVRDIRCEVVDS